jgi:hypothetical protein
VHYFPDDQYLGQSRGVEGDDPVGFADPVGHLPLAAGQAFDIVAFAVGILRRLAKITYTVLARSFPVPKAYQESNV